MPAEVTALGDEEEAPKANHLALMTGDGMAIAIPPGATLIMVTGKKLEPCEVFINPYQSLQSTRCCETG